MLGTFVDCLAIIGCSLVGMLFKNGISEKYNQTVMQAMGLALALVGIESALGCDDLPIIIISLAIGSVLGEFVGIEAYLESLGKFLERRFSKTSDGFAKGFITGSLIFCVGSMAIVGALEDGLTGDHHILFAKACLDGIIGLILASSLGIGVMFASLAVLVYQGGITLMAVVLKPLLVPVVVSQMSAVGGLLIMGIGLNLLREKKIRVGNMLPAVFVPMVYYLIRLYI
ncbi:MAG: DUF554 domain-containing protein [Desulfobacteraceae bacterium]|nr:DUF554 domain-containing protein [Desulfobacteraceae bacterium]